MIQLWNRPTFDSNRLYVWSVFVLRHFNSMQLNVKGEKLPKLLFKEKFTSGRQASMR